MKKYLFLLIGILGLTIVLQQRALTYQKKEKLRFKNNTEALLKDVQFYRTSDSLNAAQVQQLELTKSELKKWLDDKQDEINKLKIKNRDLSHVAETHTSTTAVVETVVYDTILKMDSILIPSKCFDFDDNYISLHGCISETKFQGNLCIIDTLFITETVKRKRFLGFLWKTKKIKDTRWDIYSRNPYTNFTDFQVVKLIY